MVFQRTAPSAQAAAGGRGSRERRNTCLGCNHGLGQFAVEFPADDYNSSGRGYCSLDCYTSAKVTGRTMQMQGRPAENRYNPQQQQGRGGGRGRGYYGEPQPQPWPTGFLVEAPPSPKPWRGQDWVLLSSHRHHHHDGSSSSSGGGSVSWRTGRSSSNGTLSSADGTSSQESSVADWHPGGSDDGEIGAEGGGARAGQTGRRTSAGGAADSGPGSGGDAVPGNGGSGGNTAPGEAVGADVGCQGGNRRRDGGHPRAGAAVVGAEAVPRERLPPLAPIPRLGAFPAQHLVDGTAKGNGSQLANGGSRRAGFRTVAGPSARADPSPRRADADAPSPAGVRAAAAVPAAGSGRQGAVPGAAGVVAGGASARSEGYSRRKSDAGGSLSPPAAAGSDESAGTEGASSAEAQRQTEPDGKAGGVRGKGQERTAGVVKTEAQLPAAAAPLAAADAATDRCGEPKTAGKQGGNAPSAAAAAAAASRSAQRAESNSAALAFGQHRGLVSCVPVRTVSTKVAVRQWRRMFLP